MITFYTILFIIFVGIGAISSIYITIILKKNGYPSSFSNIGLFSNIKNLWFLAKEQKKYKPLFFVFISSTILSLVMFILIALS